MVNNWHGICIVLDKGRKIMGYYTVMINADEHDRHKIPYRVLATSDYHAARIVRETTGYLVRQDEVEGPYSVA